ncbi:VOC family protein [Microbacterium karelineae]|uniref:VOC family protein n=1 Tax=Microbacterium karelineae TaxID=2654283 RepID=UPI0012EA08F6|nr:VOC family protein [Microbacterium karelineae]
MAVKITTYIGFSGDAEEALTFYHGVLGGTLDITRYADMPMDGMEGEPTWVMHGQLEVPGGATIMAADTAGGADGGSRVDVILYGDDADELAGAFEGLSSGGSVTIPWAPAPWGSFFGQFTDRFGVSWMIEGGGEQA